MTQVQQVGRAITAVPFFPVPAELQDVWFDRIQGGPQVLTPDGKQRDEGQSRFFRF
jgi:hypothetical protein